MTLVTQKIKIVKKSQFEEWIFAFVYNENNYATKISNF